MASGWSRYYYPGETWVVQTLYIDGSGICDVWNSLPIDVVNAPSVNSFKKRVTKFNLDRFLTIK